MDMLSLLIAVAVLATVFVVALRREADRAAARAKARRRREALSRAVVALRGMHTGFAQLGVAAGRAAVTMRAFSDTLERTHRTTARPAHRSPRSSR